MKWLGNLWTNAVAYVALIIGSGVSIAGNVADTHRIRGASMDQLDIVMAVLWPALVVIMVHMFVSERWTGQPWPMQWLRWAGTLSIGGMAMRVSWVHLNDLMLSRNAATDVAMLGPLAIDALAIMATALILSGRGHGHPDTDTATATDTWTLANPRLHADTEDMDIWPEDMSEGMANEVESYLATMAAGGRPAMDTDSAPAMSKPGSDRTRTVVAKVPADWQTEAMSLIDLSLKSPDAPKAGEVEALLAAWYGVSDRTIRRLRPRLREEWGTA